MSTKPYTLSFKLTKSVLSPTINPLPDMPMLGSSNSAANKNMMSKILTTGDTTF